MWTSSELECFEMNSLGEIYLSLVTRNGNPRTLSETIKIVINTLVLFYIRNILLDNKCGIGNIIALQYFI